MILSLLTQLTCHVHSIKFLSGGTVVHITSGFSALAAALVIGQPSKNNAKQTAHSIPLVFVGTALIWFGWLVIP